MFAVGSASSSREFSLTLVRTQGVVGRVHRTSIYVRQVGNEQFKLAFK